MLSTQFLNVFPEKNVKPVIDFFLEVAITDKRSVNNSIWNYSACSISGGNSTTLWKRLIQEKLKIFEKILESSFHKESLKEGLDLDFWN